MPDHARTPAVIYAAKSTEDKKGSIPDQLRDCRALADREGWEVIGEFQDEGFSAYTGNRGPGLERAKRAATRAAEDHGRCVLVAWDADRFARGCGDEPGAADHLFNVHGELGKRNVEMWTERSGRKLNRMEAFMEGERSYSESERKQHAVRAGKRRRAEKGDSTGPLQFGYRLEFDGETGKGRRVPDPEQAPIVRRMFGMLDQGRTVGEITRWLNAEKVKTKRGNHFGRPRVHAILTNPWYGGRMVAYGEVVDGNHEPILPWEEFERISAKLPKRTAPPSSERKGGRPAKRVRLLSSAITCAHCGSGIWHRAGKRRSYLCGNVRHATGVCDAKPFDAQLAEEAVLRYLEGMFFDFQGWLDGVTSHRDSQREDLEGALAGVREERSKLDRREQRKRRDYREAEDAFASKAALGALRELEQERERLDAEEGAVLKELERDGETAAEDQALDFWNRLSEDVRERVVGAASVREANAALRETFAAIFVRSPEGGPPRLDFVLQDREPGAPLVSASLWATDPTDPEHANVIEGWQRWEPEHGETVPLTKVNRCLAEGRARLRELRPAA